MDVFVGSCPSYTVDGVLRALAPWRPVVAQHIRPGDRVLLKPNWLAHRHKYDEHEWESVITHPTVITAVLEIVLDCLAGTGSVVITDGPQTDSSWVRIMERMEPERWVQMGRARGVTVEVLDLRDHEWETRGDVNVHRRPLQGDPLGSTVCDLGAHSEFGGHTPSALGYYGADYDATETNTAHSGGRNMYKVSRTVISADVFINLPKLKTHKKAGITCSLKNLVGINTYKNWLPHHTEGTPDQGGDQFPSRTSKRGLERAATRAFKSVLVKHPELGRMLVPVKALGKKFFGETRETIRSGNWHGNDTIWRTVLDLNKVLLYANPDGSLRAGAAASRKRYLSVVDGIVAGEGNGPEAPERKACGVLIAGTSAVAVDAACARLMGLNWRQIPSIARAFEPRSLPVCDFQHADITLRSPDPRFNGRLDEIPLDHLFWFRPHFGWIGHIEMVPPGLAERLPRGA